MFGGDAQAWRNKAGGIDQMNGRLPSLWEHDARTNGATLEIDQARLARVGATLVERTGLDLQTIWERISEGHDRVQFNLISERLSRIGCGILSVRELGVLQRVLAPSADGFVCRVEWFKVFADAPPSGRDLTTAAGAPVVRGTHDVHSLQQMRIQGAPPRSSVSVSESWPGGFKESDLADDRTRLAVAVDEEWQRNGGSTPYSKATDAPVAERVTPFSSPTFNETVSAPPFATGPGLSELDSGGRPWQGELRVRSLDMDGSRVAASATAPYGTADNERFGAPNKAKRSVTPFATGASWGA